MKLLLLPIAFAFSVFCSHAQLSAGYFGLKVNNTATFGFSTSTSQSDAVAQTEGFFKKQSPIEIKSSRLAYGLIAGPTLFNTINTLSKDITGTKMKFGMQFGLNGTYQLSKLFGLKSGLGLMQKGYKDESLDFFTSDKVNYSSTFNYLNIPILATLNFGNNIHFYGNAGPVFGIWLGGRIKSNGNSEKIGDGMSPAELAILFGGGAIIPLAKDKKSHSISLIADLNYQLGITGVYYESSHVFNAGFAFGVGVLINASEAFEVAKNSSAKSKESKENAGDRKERNPESISSPWAFGLIAGSTLYNREGNFGSEMKSKFGVQFGLIGTYLLNDRFGLKSGLIFSQKGFIYESVTFWDSSYVDTDWAITYNYLDIPLLVTCGFGDNIRFYGNAGPVVGFRLGEKTKIDNNTEKWKADELMTDLSLLIGGGAIIPILEYNKGITISLLTDLNYQFGIGDIHGTNSDVRNRGFACAVGVLIGGI